MTAKQNNTENSKLDEQEEEWKEITPQKSHKPRLVLLGVALFVILVVSTLILGNAPMIPYNTMESYTEVVPYNTMESYSEEVPTNVVESYYDSEPYTNTVCNQVELAYKLKWVRNDNTCVSVECASYSQVCVEQNFWGNCVRYEARCNSEKCVRWNHICGLEVTNLDTQASGSFAVDGTIRDSNSNLIFTRATTSWVNRADKDILSWSYTGNAPDVYCSYQNFKAPTKSVCENIIQTRTVLKERTVVGSKTVWKERPVVESRTETKTRPVVRYHSLFDSWGI